MNENKGTKESFKEKIFNNVNEDLRALKTLLSTILKYGKVDFEVLKEKLGKFEGG